MKTTIQIDAPEGVVVTSVIVLTPVSTTHIEWPFKVITLPTNEELREWAKKVADIPTADNLADDLYIKVKILRDQLLKGGE